MLDDLTEFKNWWIKTREFNLPHEAISGGNGVRACVLYRRAPYQVEIVIVPENFDIPDHTHPSVDSYEVYLSGDISFRINGKIYNQSNEDSSVRVRPNDLHGGKFGGGGGYFCPCKNGSTNNLRGL